MPNWNQVLSEIHILQASRAQESHQAVDLTRKKYLAELFNYTGRNIIAYYSGFLSKPDINSEINDEDKNGILMAVHQLDRTKGLDLILHTPGGGIAATHSILDYLHQMFNKDIRAIVPQIAMSAGTIISCSCKKILMAKHSNLGPIDPHLRGVPAHGVILEFKRACEEIKADSSKIPLWQSIISQYRPTFLSQCENAIDWSNKFVEEQLTNIMFGGQIDASAKAKKVVEKLSNYTNNKTHNRHIHFQECLDMGLNVELIENDAKLQDLILTVHHCYMHSLMNTPSFKMIENHLGVAFVKQQQVVMMQQKPH